MTFKALLRRAICGVTPLFLLVAIGGTDVTRAQAPDAQAPDGNALPSVVGRISTVDGEIYRASTENAGNWDPITLNYPVTTGDNLWIAEGGRSEIDFGGGQVRAAGPTNVNVAQLDEHNLGLFVAEGRISVHVRVLDAGDTAVVDTPTTQVQITRPGLYDIEVSPDHGTTTLTVRQGNATMLAGNGPQPVFPGQRASVSENSALDIRGASPFDGFDSWVAQRDRLYEQNRNTAYVSREMVGYADLDQYGSWQNQSDMGPVWYPNTVAPGWTPYSDGFWTNTPGFGLTWVDAAPWGYAPFHYGRWAFVGSRWGWMPGTYVARPVWAPALVAWTGGNGWSVGVSVGGPVYGWVPLGWREPFNPWWRGCSEGCWNNFNRPYQVNITYNNFYRSPPPPSSFANWHVPGAVMAVPAAALASRAPLARDRIALSPAALTAAPVLPQPVTIRPQLAPAKALQVGTHGAPPPASTLFANSRPARLGLSPAAAHRSVPGNGNGNAQGVAPSNHGPFPSAAGPTGGSKNPGGGHPGGVGQSGPVPAQNQVVREPNQAGNRAGQEPFKRGPVNNENGTPYPTNNGATNPAPVGNNPPKSGNGPTYTPKPPNGVPGNGAPANSSSGKGDHRVPGSESPPRSDEGKRDVQHAPPPGGAPNRNTYVPGAGPGGNGGGNPYVAKPPVQGAQGGAAAHVEGTVPPRGTSNAVPDNNRVVNQPKSEPKNEPKNENKDKSKDKDK